MTPDQIKVKVERGFERELAKYDNKYGSLLSPRAKGAEMQWNRAVRTAVDSSEKVKGISLGRQLGREIIKEIKNYRKEYYLKKYVMRPRLMVRQIETLTNQKFTEFIILTQIITIKRNEISN